MPLRCLDTDIRDIQAFDLTDEQWGALKLDNKIRRHLRMPCCCAPVVMKRSPRGIKFFAHKVRGVCTSAPETEEHLLLKQAAVEAARNAGWICATEVAGATPSGEAWIADVLAEKGKHRVAIEIQWSDQSADVTMYRQERYRQSGVRCLWLFRRSGFPISEALPAVYVGGDKSNGFDIRIPSQSYVSRRDFEDTTQWTQIIPMTEFFGALFDKRFRYGAPIGTEANVIVHSGVLECWRTQCQARTRIVTFVEVKLGPHTCGFKIRTLGAYPDFLSHVLRHIPPIRDLGTIKSRYSRTLGERYMSNGCYRCDALIGDHFEHDAWYSDEKVLATFPITIDGQWLELIGENFGWAIHGREP